MKAILIDSYNKEVREVELKDGDDHGTLNQMYELIKCSCVDAFAGIFDHFIRPELGDDTLWFDDEGRLKAGKTRTDFSPDSSCRSAFRLQGTASSSDATERGARPRTTSHRTTSLN